MPQHEVARQFTAQGLHAAARARPLGRRHVVESDAPVAEADRRALAVRRARLRVAQAQVIIEQSRLLSVWQILVQHQCDFVANSNETSF